MEAKFTEFVQMALGMMSLTAGILLTFMHRRRRISLVLIPFFNFAIVFNRAFRWMISSYFLERKYENI